MRLYEKDSVLCTLLVPAAAGDGEGGYTAEYAEGMSFLAHFKSLTGPADGIAGQVRTCSRFTVTVPDPAETMVFCPGDVFREDGTGRLFTVTGEAEKTPSAASFSFLRFPAEAWENAAEGKEEVL